jgi:hypothetical protein
VQQNYHTTPAHYPAQTMQSSSGRIPAHQPMVRSGTQQVAPPAPQHGRNLQQRTVLARPSRGVEANSAPRSASLPEPQPARAFGAAAMHDEAVLDIPAYLRRSRS